MLRFQSPLQLALSGEEGWGADIHHLAASARLSGSSASVRSGGETGGTADRQGDIKLGGAAKARERGDGRWCRMRGIGGSVPGRGGAARPGTGRGEPGKDQGCGVRFSCPGGESGAEAEVYRARDRTRDPQEGVGAVTRGKRTGWGSDSIYLFVFIL